MKYFSNIKDVEEWFYCDNYPRDKIRMKYLISQEVNDSKDLSCGIAELDPGDEHLLHYHTKEAELYYVLSGHGKVRVKNDERDVGPGTAIYIPRGVKHSIRNDGTEKFTILWVYDQPSTNYSIVWVNDVEGGEKS